MGNEEYFSALNKLINRELTIAQLVDVLDRLKTTGKESLAVQLYKIWIEFNPDDPWVCIACFNCAALVASSSGDLADAQQLLERAVRVKPDFLPAYINLGTIQERAGLLSRAVSTWWELANYLEKVSPQSIRHKKLALNQIARVLEECKKDENAELV